MQFTYYRELVRAMVKPKRFEHSLCVEREAIRLARRYGEDEEKAQVAGLLHDICKNQPPCVQLQLIKKSGIMPDSVFLEQKDIWHGFAAASFLENELKLTDEAIINAVRYHTTGRANMTGLEQVVYLADLTSADRHYKDVEIMRQLVEVSLDDAMREALKFIVADLIRHNLPVNTDTLLCHRQFVAERPKE